MKDMICPICGVSNVAKYRLVGMKHRKMNSISTDTVKAVRSLPDEKKKAML